MHNHPFVRANTPLSLTQTCVRTYRTNKRLSAQPLVSELQFVSSQGASTNRAPLYLNPTNLLSQSSSFCSIHLLYQHMKKKSRVFSKFSLKGLKFDKKCGIIIDIKIFLRRIKWIVFTNSPLSKNNLQEVSE